MQIVTITHFYRYDYEFEINSILI